MQLNADSSDAVGSAVGKEEVLRDAVAAPVAGPEDVDVETMTSTLLPKERMVIISSETVLSLTAMRAKTVRMEMAGTETKLVAVEKASAGTSDDSSVDKVVVDVAVDQRAVSPVLTAMPVEMTAKSRTVTTERPSHELDPNVNLGTIVTAEKQVQKMVEVGVLPVAEEDRVDVVVDVDHGKSQRMVMLPEPMARANR